MEFKVQSLTEVWKDTKLYCLGLVAALGIVVGSVFSYQTVVKPIASSFTIGQVKADDENTVDMSYSFYDMTAWLAAFYNAASSPSGYQTIKGNVDEASYKYHSLLTQAAIEGANTQDEEGKGKWTYADKTWVNPITSNIGGGGALLGFPDQLIIKGKILGFFASKTSSSTVDYSYDSLSSTESKSYNSLETYAYYGASLDALGIDSNVGVGLSGFHPIRLVGGAIVWIGYILSSSAELLFKVVISILKVTNPFNWFAEGFNYVWSSADKNSALAGLTSLVSGMYKTFYNFGWAVMIPVTIAMLLFMFIFTGNGRQNQGLIKSKAAKFRYFIIYVLFLAVGVPVLGTSYTAGLNYLSETFDSNNVGNGASNVDSIIYSTYVDNKAWIENNRMYLPNDVPLTWSRNNSDVTNFNKANVRKYALSINALNYGDAATAKSNSANISWNVNDKKSDQNKTSSSVNALLLSYMNSSIYPASNWETLVKAKLTDAIKKGGSNSDKGSLVNRMSASATELTSKKGYEYLAYVNPHVQEGDGGIKIDDVQWWKLKVVEYKFGEYPNIFLSKGFADDALGGIISNTLKGTSGEKAGWVELKANPSVEITPDLVYGSKATMSYLEMFNYLNSKFTPNKVQVYSTNALASNVSRETHAVVNQVGAGYVHKFMIWLNTVTLLFGIAFLAIGYAGSMLIGSFKRYTNLIMSIFMGTMGMQKAMVKSAAGTIMLIFEVVGTLVIYELVKTIYMAIPDILTSAVASLNGGSTVTTTILTQIGLPVAVADLGGFVLVIFSLILSVIILVWALLVFLRIRKPIMEMADSTFTSLIAKLFYADADMAKGEDGKGGSTGMNSGVAAAAGAAGGFFSSNVEGAEGDDNDGFVDGDNQESNENEEETEEGDNPKEKGEEQETPRSDSKEANSKETEKLGEGVKDQKGVDRSQGKDGKPAEANSDAPKGEEGVGESGEDGMSAKEAAEAAEIAKANAQKSSSASGSSKESSESKGITSVSDDDTVNVEANSETPAEYGSGESGTGTLSPQIPSETGSGKQGDDVKASSESGKVEKGSEAKTDSSEQLAKQGEVEASKELSSNSGGSTPTSRSQQHRQQSKVDAIGARESASQAKSDAISFARDASQGTHNVASGVGSIAAGVSAMASGDASGKEIAAQGVQQTIEGAKQLGSSISSGVSSVKNAASSVSQGVSAVANVGVSVGTAIADSKVGQATGKVASKVGSVAGAGAVNLGGKILDAGLEGAGLQPVARRVNSSTPVSNAGAITSTITTTTTSGGTGGATTTTTVTSQTQAGNAGGNQQVQSSGRVLQRVGNHVENEVKQSLADMAPGAGISNGGGTTVVQRQNGSRGFNGSTVVNTTTTSTSGAQGSSDQTVRVTSTGQSSGNTSHVTTTTTSNGGSNQTVQKQVNTQTVQNSVPTSGGSGISSSGNKQIPSSGGGSGNMKQTTTTTTNVVINRGGGDSGPRNVPQAKGNTLKQVGNHVENEVLKSLADMSGTPTSSANSDDIANELMEKMKREDIAKARKKRFNRPR